MIIEFSVGNYRSFRELVTFSMVAANIKSKPSTLDANNVFQLQGHPALLTSAAVYGANASGKSNFVKALDFMRNFVLDSPKETRSTGAIATEPFAFNMETDDQPSHFEMAFIVEGTRYRYGFEVTTERVTTEWLFYVPKKIESRLFERVDDEVVLSGVFKEGKEIIERTRPNALFLSVVAQFNGKIAQTIVMWFRKLSIASGLQDQSMRLFTIQSLLDGTNRDQIVQLLKSLDLGIDAIAVEKIPSATPHPASNQDDNKEGLTVVPGGPNGDRLGVRTTHDQLDAAKHKTGVVTFDLDVHESEGTRKLFALSGPVINALQTGRILIIDELDARLHPLMTSELICLFNSAQTNPHHAQLIFTTHDTNLLGSDLFRRDQIWFVEKDRQGGTDLYSLAEFKVRNDASFERDYVKGRYGAIPMLKDLHHRVVEKG